MSKFKKNTIDNICDYDEGYDRIDAYEIGWCYKCKCNPNCPYKKKSNDEKNRRKNSRSNKYASFYVEE